MDVFKQALEENKLVKIANTYFNVSLVNDKLSISPCGGGFVTPVGNIKNKEEFVLVDEIPSEYKRGVYTLDDDPQYIFEGFSVPERRWNGWAMPVFEISVIHEIIRISNETMADFYHFERDDKRGVTIVTEKDYDDTYEIEDSVITVDGKTFVVASFMSGNWTWSDYFGEKAKEMLTKKDSKTN